MLKWNVGGKERNQGRLRIKAESIVVQVDGMEIGESKERGEEEGKGLRNLIQKASCENIREVCNLRGG